MIQKNAITAGFCINAVSVIFLSDKEGLFEPYCPLPKHKTQSPENQYPGLYP